MGPFKNSRYSLKGVLMIFAMFTLFGVAVGYLMAQNPGGITWFNQLDEGSQYYFIEGLGFAAIVIIYLGIRRYTRPQMEEDDINGD